MKTILIFAAVMVPIFVVIVPWAIVVQMGFSKSKERLITRRREEWILCLVAIFFSLGGLVAVPALAGAHYFLTTGEVLGLAGIIFGVVAFGLWFPAARQVGLWEI